MSSVIVVESFFLSISNFYAEVVRRVFEIVLVVRSQKKLENPDLEFSGIVNFSINMGGNLLLYSDEFRISLCCCFSYFVVYFE